MKNYKKKYEDVYTSQRLLKKCNLEKVETDNGIGLAEYSGMFISVLGDYQKFLFDYWVKIYWLMRRFVYNGTKRTKIFGVNNHTIDGAFGTFMRGFVGYDNRFLTNRSLFTKIASYFDSFFPDFDVNNPFESKYDYPYKYMTLECLFLVYQMPERLELLKVGEERKMRYLQFCDYIINYIGCYNDEHGEEYQLINSKMSLFYVRSNKYYEYTFKKIKTGNVH